MGIRAERVEVCWLGEDDPLRVADRGFLFFLGQAQGVTVLYDSETMETLRVGTGQVALVMFPTGADIFMRESEPELPWARC